MDDDKIDDAKNTPTLLAISITKLEDVEVRRNTISNSLADYLVRGFIRLIKSRDE